MFRAMSTERNSKEEGLEFFFWQQKREKGKETTKKIREYHASVGF